LPGGQPLPARRRSQLARRLKRLLLLGAVGALVAAWIAAAATHGLTVADSIVLGVVEGVTEFLPISSTGHLTVAERLLDIGRHGTAKTAADAYAICIQAGAILAVLVLYRERIGSLFSGLAGRDRSGRRLLGVLVVAFVPAAAIGVAFDDPITKHLFGVGPVIAAWAVGGVAILWVAGRWRGGGRTVESLTPRDGLIIGVAQALALWPGVSRSLVTILAALALGLTIEAAVEFSFILGLATLGAATAYTALKDGNLIVDHFGVAAPVIGFVVAFAAAVVAIRWMVTYLQRHDLRVFGWYRLAVAAVALVLLAAGAFG
jgi:undecaprenyl-diphosphatase